MPDGESSAVVGDQPSMDPSLSLSNQQLSLGLSQVELDDDAVKKDPRKIARKYQLELCKKAMEENIIVYLGTGCGKTHIAVLLMHEMGHLIRKPQKNICVFLAPTVALVHQQAKVIADSTDFKVGIFCGSSKRLKRHQDWEQEIGQYEVLVMTPQILVHNLSHCFIMMEMIALLIFDECHHAQVKSNHAYAVIMKIFYNSNSSKVPRIFGMTASPVVGKGASSEANLARSINSLEHMLDAKVYSVEDKELKSFVTTPVINIYHYASTASGETSMYLKIEEIKSQCIANVGRSSEDHQKRMNTKKLLNRMHDNVVFCLQNLGIWGALQASHILLSGDRSERHELVEAEGNSSDDSVCDTYLAQVAELFTSQCIKGDNVSDDLSSSEILKEPFFSAKLLRLFGILSTFRLQKNMKCIIFVNRIVTASSLSYILQKLKLLRQWRSDYLVGVHSGLKSMSRKTMNMILDKFRSGELNLLVATKVGEEGLDIQTCCLVIRFDLPETVASFIQSRGRARMPQSEYAFMVDSRNKKELDIIGGFEKDEYRMNMEVTFRTSDETFIIPEENIFRVESTGASVSSGYSISLLHQYCSKLPHDEYFDPKPNFYFLDDSEGIVCHIRLPSNAPIHQILGAPQLSMEASKRDACLKAIEELYKLGALSNFLLPKEDDAAPEEQVSGSTDEDECEDAISRGELHEMLVPSAFGQSWTNKDEIVHLNSYYIKFCPCPVDRVYKEFGLFIMARLPMEAEKLELDLHLAHGRSVMTKFVPFGVVEFNKDEIKMAEKFQEMFLKIILDRLEFVAETVDLGMTAEAETSSSTFYLLLPVVLQEYGNAMKVDWKTVKRCLWSPIFRHPQYTMDKRKIPFDIHLQLANGYKSVRDVENSLVYAPHKRTFYFVTNIDHEKTGFSLHKESGTSSYADDLIEKFSIHLKYPEQPLLHVKPLPNLHNLLHNRKREDAEPQELDEYLIYLPPELCELKIIGFSKDIGSSISLLPSIMHRLGNLLVAIELKQLLSFSFPEAAEVSALRVLEALTTEKCQERFSLERLEVLGDAFLKFVVARHFFLVHDSFHEGDLTKRRSNAVNNSNLLKLAIGRNLQIYICDQIFDPSQFYALGRPCPRICCKETEESIHFCANSVKEQGKVTENRCNKNHHWLHKKTVADVVEALVGAFLVDSGFKAAVAFLTWIGIQVGFEASQVVDICMASAGYIPLSSDVDIPSLESKLGHQFLHKGLLLQAFVHPSYNKLGGGCYQRLEFLGDAVLDYLIASYLFSAYPKLKPGQLTDLRSLSANNKAFACVAVDRSFDKYLLCDSNRLSEAIKKYVDYVRSPSTDSGIKEGPKYPKALGDVVESCVGAILLDTGFNLNKVWKIMTSFLDPIMKFSSSLQLSPIRDLRELCQAHNLELEFLPVASKLTKTFTVEAKASGNNVCETASATGQNKKEACRIASLILFSKFKAQGWKAKSKTLEEVLESTSKMEPKLIGYDETPIDVTDTNTAKHIMVTADLYSKSNPEIRRIPDTDEICSPCVKRVGQVLQSSMREKLSEISENHCSSESSGAGTSRSRLYELCAAYCWKPPSFECCKEEGPAHLKQFTYKMTLEIEEVPDTILEFVGEPRSKKKDAAESAAQGAFWYLQQEGYFA
ncbi:dicer-like protein 4 isoform X2 [Vigna umbellata]|uniref:dicer-like protein 4 isoform X1 n=2 Tax=Vigna umbellata TaxID=87088 RepID=UPI001F5FBFDE|nr:dicer-like protein 4 isoform X1 [Vigna umbellata]XP_047169319.1 dicer-like protein 4 isoform X2 [Vigna umbellata]